MRVKKGDIIKVHYTGTLEDGSIFDSSKKESPVKFEVGAGEMIRGFDEAVLGMQKGETRSVMIPPEKAYGFRMDMLIQSVPLDAVPEDIDIEIGSTLTLEGPEEQLIPAKIVEVKEEEVFLDLNHPLADKTLQFKIELVDC
ncbi:peptidylprolyl isomerase [Candidatus Woesearchaeota archaeon]|jgi:peptidylprolyl isomerase|nr:peptidylprolyl isomerase [Candidatus Woesearchaeota archaeon]